MDIISSLLVIGGLVVFEIVKSIENAIISAHALKTMSVKWNKFFILGVGLRGVRGARDIVFEDCLFNLVEYPAPLGRG